MGAPGHAKNADHICAPFATHRNARIGNADGYRGAFGQARTAGSSQLPPKPNLIAISNGNSGTKRPSRLGEKTQVIATPKHPHRAYGNYWSVLIVIPGASTSLLALVPKFKSSREVVLFQDFHPIGRPCSARRNWALRCARSKM